MKNQALYFIPMNGKLYRQTVKVSAQELLVGDFLGTIFSTKKRRWSHRLFRPPPITSSG
jgi:hypothetical protein